MKKEYFQGRRKIVKLIQHQVPTATKILLELE